MRIANIAREREREREQDSGYLPDGCTPATSSPVSVSLIGQSNMTDIKITLKGLAIKDHPPTHPSVSPHFSVYFVLQVLDTCVVRKTPGSTVWPFLYFPDSLIDI